MGIEDRIEDLENAVDGKLPELIRGAYCCQCKHAENYKIVPYCGECCSCYADYNTFSKFEKES